MKALTGLFAKYTFSRETVSSVNTGSMENLFCETGPLLDESAVKKKRKKKKLTY